MTKQELYDIFSEIYKSPSKMRNLTNTLLAKIEQEKKEQAREIFEKLKEECSYEGYLYGLDYLEIAEIAKEYGVEL